MSDTATGILGLITIAALVITLFKSKTQPAIAFIIWPAILALILIISGRNSVKDISAMIASGFSSVGPTAALFVFSVLFFGIMTDAGMFDVIIGRLMHLVGDNVVGVAVVTCIIAMIGHLDGSGASTFCIVIPAMLPVYIRMHMRRTSLLRISVLAMGVLNLMPWAGPSSRAASILGIESIDLWQTIMPIQLFGIVLAFAYAVMTGLQEKKRGAGLKGDPPDEDITIELLKQGVYPVDSELSRPKLFIFNILLTAAVIAMLIWDEFPGYFPFMLGCSIALFVNYGFSAKAHKDIINRHAGPALIMCSTLMSASVLMGVLTSSIGADGKVISAKTMVLAADATPSVVRCLAGLFSGILPPFIGNNLPLVIGVLSVPLALAFDTDSYFYGLMPVIIGIGQNFGVEAMPIATAMLVCRNCATFISPMVPATLLGTGLAEVDIRDHIRNSYLYVWVFSVFCMLFALIIGILPL